MVRFKQVALLAGAVAWLWLIGPAQASPLIARLVSVTPSSGNFLWTYTASIAADERVQSGPNTVPPGISRPDFFTIYDILGLVAGSVTAPAGWTVSVQNLGIDPTFASPPSGDNPAIPNVTFTYTGAAPILGPSASIGTFTFLSSIGGINPDGSFAAETTFQGGPQDNTNVYTSGSVPVPVPEPGTLLLALAGPVFLFGAVKRGLRRQKV